jgi:hypothetical protein
MTVEGIRREIERRLQQYKMMPNGSAGAEWLDDAISIVNDVFDPYCPPADEDDGDTRGIVFADDPEY